MGARPLVTAHFAQTLDGRLSLAGALTTLSTAEGQRAAHAARAANDAVLVGSRTIRIDDPRLTVRQVPGRDPLRVVLASSLDIAPEARVFQSPPGKVLLAGVHGRAPPQAARAHLEALGAEVRLFPPGPDDLVSLDALLEHLASTGVKRLLVEGGARVLTSFFGRRLVDRVEIEIAPIFLGAPATSSLGALGVSGLAEAPRLVDVTVERLGASLLVRGAVA